MWDFGSECGISEPVRVKISYSACSMHNKH